MMTKIQELIDMIEEKEYGLDVSKEIIDCICNNNELDIDFKLDGTLEVDIRPIEILRPFSEDINTKISNQEYWTIKDILCIFWRWVFKEINIDDVYNNYMFEPCNVYTLNKLKQEINIKTDKLLNSYNTNRIDCLHACFSLLKPIEVHYEEVIKNYQIDDEYESHSDFKKNNKTAVKLKEFLKEYTKNK